MPTSAAGWRIEPPVSVPMDSGTWYAATADAEPPLLPPGTRPRSHGLAVGPQAENSVDEPMANSSMLVLPGSTAPAARSCSAMWASYWPMWPSRIRLPAVAGSPLVRTRSLSATGMPVSGARSSRLRRAVVGRVGLGAGSLRIDEDPGVQRAVRCLDGREVSVRQLARRELAAAQAVGHLVGEQAGQVGHRSPRIGGTMK